MAVFPVICRRVRAGWLAILAFALVPLTLAQQPEQKQEIPDAPSTVHPPQPFPNAAPESKPAPPNRTPHGEANPENAPAPAAEAAPPRPPMNITTVPEGGATPGEGGATDDLYKIVTNVNQVLVPVMVKDGSGRLVNGLLPRDFSVYEDGKKQKLNFFTTDPFALSAAVIVDTGLPDVALEKVTQTFPALEGAFSQFDEVSIYTYSSAVSKVSDFSAAGKQLTATLNELKTVSGRNNGPPVTAEARLQRHSSEIRQCYRWRSLQRLLAPGNRKHIRSADWRRAKSIHPRIRDPRHPEQRAP